ncbi:YtxH domain-containing protein [Lacticaseibacillus brantae]|uniref:Gas vesicle protein n=1 Tax=Lacticaseibacillus brantae DSM 23927 TaxID=1423727 RepID=A0A0R2B4N5_9LACO|nr:YtxH domain-containing protein [Lacticaseibacillus brantae]KRM72900.1 hypothetical protein FC34_GL000612 [Lacticaseibacillus brantae DSM 23927]
MMKFRTGFLLGGLAGVAYGLLTAKRTGVDQQQAIAQYFTDVSQATGNVQRSVSGLGDAISRLKQEIDETLVPAVKDITETVDVFEFETEPRVQSIENHVETINSAVEDLSK